MIWSRTGRLALLTTVVLSGCANRGMQEPTETGSGGTLGDSGSGGTTVPASGGSGGGAGSPVGSGGRGGTVGTGGTLSTGGTVGAGGTTSTGGAVGTGGTTSTGGTVGTGGTTATGGTMGTGGMAGAPGKGGATGTGGTVATGGTTGTGGVAGAGGRGGAGGAGGGALMCSGGMLDCSTAGALKLPGGLVTDFSAPQWNATTGQFCDADGLSGRLFSFKGTNTGSTAAAVVDTTAENLKLNLTAKDWAGGGVIFESCANVSGFTSLAFRASLTAGSLTGCTWQVQLQTQDQRASTDVDPTGGTCASNCYRYPAVSGLATPSATGTSYTEPFTMFNNPSSSTVATPTQVVGLQWQVTSNSSNGCTAELRIDNIRFQ